MQTLGFILRVFHSHTMKCSPKGTKDNNSYTLLTQIHVNAKTLKNLNLKVIVSFETQRVV